MDQYTCHDCGYVSHEYLNECIECGGVLQQEMENDPFAEILSKKNEFEELISRNSEKIAKLDALSSNLEPIQIPEIIINRLGWSVPGALYAQNIELVNGIVKHIASYDHQTLKAEGGDMNIRRSLDAGDIVRDFITDMELDSKKIVELTLQNDTKNKITLKGHSVDELESTDIGDLVTVGIIKDEGQDMPTDRYEFFINHSKRTEFIGQTVDFHLPLHIGSTVQQHYREGQKLDGVNIDTRRSAWLSVFLSAIISYLIVSNLLPPNAESFGETLYNIVVSVVVFVVVFVIAFVFLRLALFFRRRSRLNKRQEELMALMEKVKRYRDDFKNWYSSQVQQFLKDIKII